MSTIEATEACPVYKKVADAGSGATPMFFIVCDEGWRESIVCERMYEWAADWLVETLQGLPYAPNRRSGQGQEPTTTKGADDDHDH